MNQHYGETVELEGDHILMTLPKELDYIPLAIPFNPTILFRLFLPTHAEIVVGKEDSLLQTPGRCLDKLESIEVSISISLSSLDSTDNHQAIQLLDVLCLLSDDLLHWEEQLWNMQTF